MSRLSIVTILFLAPLAGFAVPAIVPVQNGKSHLELSLIVPHPADQSTNQEILPIVPVQSDIAGGGLDIAFGF